MRLARFLRPWPLVAGAAIAAVGAVLIFLAAFRVLPPVAAVAFVLSAALVELVSGLSLWRRGGPSMAHIFSGALALGLISFAIAASRLGGGGPVTAQPVALALALYCSCNGLFRVIDVVVDRPEAPL